MDSLKSALGVVVAVQTLLVVALFFKLSRVESDLADMKSANAIAVENASAAAPASYVPTVGLSQNELRAAIREELLPIKAALSEMGRDGGPALQAVTAPPRTAQTDRLFLDFQSDLQKLVAKGSASEAEMAALESKIAGLPADQRQAALSKISRAMSNGSLKGNF